MERLHKLIAQSGIASRRKAEELIKNGYVKVDGLLITEMGYKVNNHQTIEVDGKVINKENKVYFLLYKPKKVICTNNDEKNRTIVTSFIDCKERIFPVGRLDYDTSGLILLTNDGDFSNKMIHPRYHIPKVYDLDIKGILTNEHLISLEKGIYLDNKLTLPAKIKVKNRDYSKNLTTLEIKISEGRYHQVKRMFEYYDYKVTRLMRKKFAFLNLNGLNPGDYRILKPFEIKRLISLSQSGTDIK